MSTRDRRWEKVQARFGHLPFDEEAHTEAEIRQLRRWLQIKIWVVYNGMYYWCEQKIHEVDYYEATAGHPEVFGFIMDEMVKYIDRQMVDHLQPPLNT